MLFSIADIDNAPESAASGDEEIHQDPESEHPEEFEEDEEDSANASLPIRTAITITKVRLLYALLNVIAGTRLWQGGAAEILKSQLVV